MPHAFDRRAGVVVKAHGQAHMALINQALVGHVNARPAPLCHIQAHVGPGMAGQIRLVGSIKIAADIARRNSQAAAHRHHHMRLVLAHAGARVKSLQRSGSDVSAMFFIPNSARYTCAKCQNSL